MNKRFKWVVIDIFTLIVYCVISIPLIVGAFSWGERDGSGILVVIMLFPYLIAVLCIFTLLILLHSTKVKIKKKMFYWLNVLIYLPLVSFAYLSHGERIAWFILLIVFPVVSSYLYVPMIRKINALILENHRLEIDR